jgi:phosphoesterase RecJ-like protein
MSSLSNFCTELHTKLLTLTHVVLIAHKTPDGDAFGSLEGMRQLLIANYPTMTVSVVIPEEKHEDTHVSWVISDRVTDIPSDAELVLFLDASPLSRTALDPAQYPTQPVITIDHHEPRPDSIDGYRDVEVASTTSIITDIARTLNWTLTPRAATALLLGIYTDTGGFIHRNSNQHAFQTAAFLMSCGAEQ